MSQMKVISCSCQHSYQDEKYGKGKRMANKTKKTNPDVYRCTVCKREIVA